jgi:DNA polymerase elongation subunit (family B)
MVSRAPLHCPPRHEEELAPPSDSLRLQVISVVSKHDPVAWESPAANMTGPCENVHDDDYFAQAQAHVKDETAGHYLKPWQQQHSIVIHGRTDTGRSVHLVVKTDLSIAVEFPETHADFRKDVWSYFLQMETSKELRFGMGYFCNAQLQKRFMLRARSNNWTPDPADKTKPKRWPVAVVSFRNKADMNKAVRYMRNTDVVGRDGVPFKVSVWETTDYVKPEQRFLLTHKIAPAGWITVRRPLPLAWTVSTCDYEFWCNDHQITPDNEDQSIAPLTVLSWDIEVRNGTADDRKRMKSLGLDKFPSAKDGSNQVIQISVIVRTVDGRVIPFLLELDDDEEHTGDAAYAQRVFQGERYHTFWFQCEADMICHFRDLLVYYDPDIVLSFNGDRFDWPYIIARMGDRPPAGRHGRFFQMGRIVSERWDTKYVSYRSVPAGPGGRHMRDLPVLHDEGQDLPKKRLPLAQLALESGVELIPELQGRVSLDLCSLIRDLSKADKFLAFKNYTLNNMSDRFLKDKKVDFTHNDIFDAWAGMMSGQRLLQIVSNDPNPDATAYLSEPAPNEAEVDAWLRELSGTTLAELRVQAQANQRAFAATNAERAGAGLPPLAEPEPVGGVARLAQRRLLGDYCMKDSMLPIRIMDKLGSVMFLWQVSRVAQTSPNAIINNGQMIRVSTMFIGEAWRQGRYVNRVQNRAMPYQGATVLKPKRGYYGGGDGKTLVSNGAAPPPREASFELPPTPVAKAQRPPAAELQPVFARLAEQLPADVRAATPAHELAAAATAAYDELPDGYDFSGMQLYDIWQTVVDPAVLTLDFKSLYPSIMLSHLLCPSNLHQLDEPLNAAEESAQRYREHCRKRQGSPVDAAPAAAKPEIFGSPKADDSLDRLRQDIALQQQTLAMFEEMGEGDDGVESAATTAAMHDTRKELHRLKAELAKREAPVAAAAAALPDDDVDEADAEVELDDEQLREFPSGVVSGLEDEEDYTTVCIVVTDAKGVFLKRRYHKFTKHDDGILPAMLRSLLDGRAIYKKKMNLEKALQGSMHLAFEAAAGPGAAVEPDARINEALETLRAALKPVVKDKGKRAEATSAWLAAHGWVAACRERVMALVDDFVNIYDGRQKALKVMANSIYGVTGAKQHSPCACCKIAESVTAIGRQMIESTKACVLSTFKHYNPDVIYGDTDSVFVLVQEPDDKEAWRMANEIAEYCTRVIFAGTVNVLEDECIKRKLALFKKKTYVGMENEDVKTGIYERGEKGIASVRRDKPEVLNILVRQLNKAFTELGNFPTHTIARVLLRLCCHHFEKLVQNGFPVDDYVIVCRINKMRESAHVNMARKLESRTGMPVMRGDSVSFVQISDPAEPKATRRVETPVVVRANDAVKIDRAYYLSNKIKNIIASTLVLFVPPEVIEVLFEVYQSVLDNPGMRTLGQAFGTATGDPAAQRRDRVERALERAARMGRLPKGSHLPESLRTTKRKTKDTPAEKAAKRSRNMEAFRAFFATTAESKEEPKPEPKPVPKEEPEGCASPEPRKPAPPAQAQSMLGMFGFQ